MGEVQYNYCILLKVCYTIVMVMLMRHLVRLAVTLCLFALPPLYNISRLKEYLSYG